MPTDQYSQSQRAAQLARQSVHFAVMNEIETWTFPPTQNEHDIVAELIPTEPTRVSSLPVLFQWKFPGWHPAAQACHQNVQELQKMLPAEDCCQAVHGWMLHGSNYVLHSIVEHDGHMFCITPHPLGLNSIDFILDRAITMTVIDDHLLFYRHGELLPERVLRSNPVLTIAKWRRVEALIAQGMEAEAAVERASDEFDPANAR